MKIILAALLAGTFLVSLPLKAEEKGAAPAGEKAEKSKKGKDDKAAKDGKAAGGDATKKDDKAAGKGW
jgi:hypothetical protein